MSPYSWPLLDACTIIKHAFTVFRLQIPQTTFQSLQGKMPSIHKIGAGKLAVLSLSSKLNQPTSLVSEGVWLYGSGCRDRTEVVYSNLFSDYISTGDITTAFTLVSSL